MPRTQPPGGSSGGQPPPVGIAGIPDSWAALWAYLDREAYAPLKQFESDLTAFAQVSVAAANAQHQVHRDQWNYWTKPIGFSLFHLWGRLISGLLHVRVTQQQSDSATRRWVAGQLARVLLIAVRYTGLAVARERRQRRWQVARAEAQARQGDRALHHLIEREAVAGYASGGQGRSDAVTGLLAFLGDHNPALSHLISSAIGDIIDLAAIDDPIARLVLGKLLTLIADRLGVEKIAGKWAADMLAPIVGRPRPRGLTDVITDITSRVTATETQWAQFYGNGGSEVEQAGKEWAELTGPLVSVGMLAFFGLAVADPDRWAADLSGTVGALVNDTIDGAARLIREA
jgi:hypothetical protein